MWNKLIIGSAAVALTALASVSFLAVPADAAVIRCKTGGMARGCIVRPTPMIVGPAAASASAAAATEAAAATTAAATTPATASAPATAAAPAAASAPVAAPAPVAAAAPAAASVTRVGYYGGPVAVKHVGYTRVTPYGVKHVGYTRVRR